MPIGGRPFNAKQDKAAGAELKRRQEQRLKVRRAEHI
jgi:hypothetical protein